jgi:hypothetical protein
VSGYVRIHRPLFEEHPAFRNDAEAMAFAWMIVKAQWRPKAVRYKGHKIELQRGQLAVSQRDMARALDRDKAWVERLWKRLRAEAMIETTCEAGVAVITICKYNEYQADAIPCEAADEAQEEAGARQTQGTEQRREKGKKETPTRKRADGKHLIPSDWAPPPVSELPPMARACAEQWTEASYQTEGEAFGCYWRSERKMKSDWGGTWANRIISRHDAVMRAQKFGNAPPSPQKLRPPTAVEVSNMVRFYTDRGDVEKAEEVRRKYAASIGDVAGSILKSVRAA